MKNQSAIIWWISLCLFMINCNVENKKEEAKGPETEINAVEFEPKKVDVENAVNAFNEAIVNPRKDILERLCSNKLTYGHSSGFVQNREEFIEDLINGPFDFSSVTVSDQTIYLSGSTAIVRHIFLAKATNKGEPVKIRIGNILAYNMSDKGQWQLLARQAYKL